MRGAWIVLAVAACDGGHPPDLHGLADQMATVGSELDVQLNGTDPDGDRLTYGVHADIMLTGETITELPDGSGVFRWTPLAEDVGMHLFDFTVSDGTHVTTVTVTIDVEPPAGAPVFRQPLGTGMVVDLAQTPCPMIAIAIDDPDSAMVTIAQEPPVIAGAQLMQTDGLDARWMWCPTAQQVAAQDRYTLVLSADDGTHPKTIKDYVIVFAHGGAHVVINEIDYDQVGTDLAEFVEVYNPSSNTLSLSGIELVLVNGATNTLYDAVDLSPVGSLPAHGYLVIGGASVMPPPSSLKLDPGWTQDAIQNGSPDGVALVDNVSHTLVDALSYEGAITAATITGFPAPVSLVEGTMLPTTVADSNTVTRSLCRNPNGQDTDDAATDWTACSTLTPGGDNVP